MTKDYTVECVNWPNMGCVFIYPVTKNSGPHEPYKNPYVGWAIQQAGTVGLVGIYGSLTVAKSKAEEIWLNINGWKKINRQHVALV